MPIIPNHGADSTLKGHVFSLDDPTSIPGWLHAKNWPQERKEVEVKALNERYRVVAICPTCKRKLVAVEHLAHMMNHVPSRQRAFVRTLMAMSPADRKAVIESCKELEKIHGR